MGVEKLTASKMMLSDSVHRRTVMAVAGLGADGARIFARAKSEAAKYEKFVILSFLLVPNAAFIILSTLLLKVECKVMFSEPIPLKELVERVPSYVHLYTSIGCVGKGIMALRLEKASKLLKHKHIEKLKLSDMTCREGVLEVAKIIYKVHDEAKDKGFELELSWVCNESERIHQ
ncbi:unnamed protein product [Linum tenue]|uniref:Uncharacterized protein n=1 Tax=Linum tenue TaxID=586396 RepID=A0AAV0I3G9_9ROSI|nr:unnamed protein product [Linum tenue]